MVRTMSSVDITVIENHSQSQPPSSCPGHYLIRTRRANLPNIVRWLLPGIDAWWPSYQIRARCWNCDLDTAVTTTTGRHEGPHYKLNPSAVGRHETY